MRPILPHDVELKIKWANHHFLNFQKFLRAWAKSDTCRIVIEHDPDSRYVLYRLSEDFFVPRDFALLSGDILQNLRTALDYLACALVRANNGKVTDKTCFPILKRIPATPEEEQAFARKIEGMTDRAKDLIRASKPYHGGDEILWRLHELNRREKHRLLFTVGGYLSNWSVTQHIQATNMPLRRMERLARAYASDEAWSEMHRWSFPLKAGDILLSDPPDTKVNEDLEVEIQIAINEKGVSEGEPLLAVLFDSIYRVNRIVKKFDGLY
jgi:hypothetical protein